MIGIEKLKAAAIAANQAWMDEPYEIEPALVIELIERLEAAEKQRDELLSALEKVTAKLAWLNSDDCAHIMALTDDAEAVIASVKEQENV